MADWKEEIRKQLASLKLAPAREAAIVEELAQHFDCPRVTHFIWVERQLD